MIMIYFILDAVLPASIDLAFDFIVVGHLAWLGTVWYVQKHSEGSAVVTD
jgi:hypothetical protein